MIKRILSIVSFLALLTVKTFAQDFYDINTINVIEITFPQDNWDSMLDQLVSAGLEERLLGTAVINNIQFDSVGVRYKGNSSYKANQNKNPLNIKLDHIIKNQKMDNFGTLKLANVYKDPSFIREVLSYEIARNYMPASLSNYAKVYINSTYLGLYTSNQDVDKYFMRTHFASDENARIKGEISHSAMPGNMGSVWKYFGNDSSSYNSYYALESDFGWKDLIAFLDTLNNQQTDVEQVLNVDRHLWFLALENLLVNLDGPINNPQNYYLYKDDAGRFNPIPWDFNESFGVFTNHQTLGQLGTRQLQELSPFANINESEYPVISKILNNDTYRKIYVVHMKTIIADYFENGLYRTRALEIQDIIDSEVQNDPNKFYTYTDFTNNIDNSAGCGPPGPGNQSIIGIAELMDNRISYLNTQIEFQASAPAISNISLSPLNVSPNTDVWINVEVSNSSLVQLDLRYSVSAAFEKIEMLDDGNNNDGSAGDGIYGASVSTGTNGFQYYIYAENDDAASFLPARAAYEFYTLAVSGDLVINEFLASNDSTAADQDGEYDDWIELYNNTDDVISLAGYFMSDDGNDLTQWAFPDTVIAANGYLIIWADNDVEQGGLHANFKLSASGESIYLVNSGGNVIDEIIFDEQTSDISFGRYPNGTGDFMEMTPSFTNENLSSQTGIEDSHSNQLRFFVLEQNYPNPFNSSTAIGFSLPNENSVTLKIFNTLGQEVATLVEKKLQAGSFVFQWNADDFPSGVYYYVLAIGSQRDVKKMVLLR